MTIAERRDADDGTSDDDVLARVGRGIAAVAGPGELVLVEGPPGSGVSTLLAAAGARLAAAGARVVTVTAAPGGIRPILAAADPALGAAHLAGLADAAAAGPLAVLVDDVHRADDATVADLVALAAAFRRTRGLLVAGRRGSGAAGRAADLLATHADVTAAPAPLDRGDIAAALTAVSGRAPQDGAVDAVLSATGGLAAAVVAFAESEAARPEGERAGPRTVRHRAEQCLASVLRARLPGPTATAVAEVVAILGEDATARRVRELVDAPAAEVRAAIDRLLDDGILAGDVERLALISRGAGTALTRSLGASRADALQGAAADLLAAQDEPLAAGTLLLGVDPAARTARAHTLEAAADVARDTGDPDLAIRLLTRLLAEPPPAERQAGILVALGTTQVTTGRPEGVATLRHALNEARAPGDVADAAAALGWALAGGAEGTSAEEVLLEARARVASLTARSSVELDVQITDMAAWDPALHESRRAARTRLAAVDDPLAGAAVLAADAVDALRDARPAAETADLLQRSLADGALAGSPRGAPTALAMALFLGYTGQPQLGADHVDHVVSRLRGIGMPNLVAPALAFRGALRFMQGRLAEADADLRTVVVAPWLVRSTPLMAAFLLRCLLARGEDDEAARVLADLDLEGGDLQELVPHAPFLHARGLLRARRGDRPGALVDLLECGRRLADYGWPTPTVASWRSAAARLLDAEGRRDEAVALADEELRLAEAVGAPEALACALRGVAALRPADDAAVLLGRAIEVARTVAPVEHAGALGDLGERSLEAGETVAAREHLHAAYVSARSIGAGADARRASDLLRAAGGRVRRADPDADGPLTRAERRVAELATEGRTNREIAAELVVSRKTVESHLGSVFRKLGIEARSQLPETLGARAPRELP